jgi:hypothetical protein
MALQGRRQQTFRYHHPCCTDALQMRSLSGNDAHQSNLSFEFASSTVLNSASVCMTPETVLAYRLAIGVDVIDGFDLSRGSDECHQAGRQTHVELLLLSRTIARLVGDVDILQNLF